MKTNFLCRVLLTVLTVSYCVNSIHGTPTKILNQATLNERAQQYRQILSVLQNQYVDTLDMEAVIKAGIDAMLATVDPYTEYYNADNIEQLTVVASGKYGGIGCQISARDSLVVVENPYYGKPAREAGLRHGDILLQIDNYIIPPHANISEIGNKLKGNPGTSVRLKVLRPWLEDTSDSIFVFDIERKNISLDPIPYNTVFEDGTGYIDVTTFDVNTGEDVRKTVAEMKNNYGDTLKGIVLDLRANGGGVMSSAVDLLSVFINKGTKVLETRYRNGETEESKTKKTPVDVSIPIVVLVNGYTASAAEVVAGALQDLDRAVIMGRRTYGKGLVQTSAPVGYNSVIKYTTGKYYLPSGRLIQARDYRDANGEETLIPDSLTHEFHTANGRMVRDGRGIKPDYEYSARQPGTIFWQISEGTAFDDFSNRYRNKHDNIDNIDSLINNTLYKEFVATLNPEKIKWGEASKKGIEYLRLAVDYEGLDSEDIKSAIDEVEKLLTHDMVTEIDANRDVIVDQLKYSLMERYFAPDEIEAVVIASDDEVFEARKLLLDPARYKSYLSPESGNK